MGCAFRGIGLQGLGVWTSGKVFHILEWRLGRQGGLALNLGFRVKPKLRISVINR